MEKAVGVVCEFNPFHNGHALLLNRIRERFPEKPIVCVMSSNFVQRGDFAILDQYARAKAAALGGADLVLQLPFPFSCLSAESFAESAVSILDRLGAVSHLAFGSEVTEPEEFQKVAERLSGEAFQAALQEAIHIEKTAGYPALRERLYRQKFGETPLFSFPNASLGVEYIRALRKFGSEIIPVPFLREKAGFDEMEDHDGVASASFLRILLQNGEWQKIRALVPPPAFDILREESERGKLPVSMERLTPVVLYLLRTLPRAEFSRLYGFSQLGDRAKAFAAETVTLPELVARIQSPRFTASRIRRGLLALLCSIPKQIEKELPAYTLVLSATQRGRGLLASVRENEKLAVFTKPSHVCKSKNKEILRQGSRAFSADGVFALGFPTPQNANFSLRQGPFMY